MITMIYSLTIAIKCNMCWQKFTYTFKMAGAFARDHFISDLIIYNLI